MQDFQDEYISNSSIKKIYLSLVVIVEWRILEEEYNKSFVVFCKCEDSKHLWI